MGGRTPKGVWVGPTRVQQEESVAGPHIAAHPRPRTTQAARAIMSVALLHRTQAIAISCCGDSRIDLACSSAALWSFNFLHRTVVAWGIPTPNMVVFG
jgi:hypothetical protein